MTDEANGLQKTTLQVFTWLHGPGRVWGWLLTLAVCVIVSRLVYHTGGTQFAFLHLLYIPILLGAFLFGSGGGVALGLTAGLLVGPYMPLDTVAQTSQAPIGWIFRTGLFIIVGSVAGSMASLLHSRLKSVERLADFLSSIYARMLSTFALTVALRDEETAGHCERVARNARAVGAALNLESQDREALYWSGLLHDLGKIAVPEHILLKPGALTDEEYAEVQNHAETGARMLESVSDAFTDVAGGVRAHHERWDGAGYPDGLAGDAIPLYGRIISVVDVFEALTSDRPYRAALSESEALHFLSQEAGKQFDPAIVAAFVGLYERGSIRIANDDQGLQGLDNLSAPSAFDVAAVHHRSTG